MIRRFTVLLPSLLFGISCIDPLSYDIPLAGSYPIVIAGQITDQPGPYEVILTRSFDTKSNVVLKQSVKAQEVVIFDNMGEKETLQEVAPGVYRTQATGIRGQVGRVYQLEVTTLDGKRYQSAPDTLFAGSTVDSLYYNFNIELDAEGVQQAGFDIFFNATNDAELKGGSLWKFKGTFKSTATPENADITRSGCNPIGAKCNFVPVCSGLVNIATPAWPPMYERQGPCTCCDCWFPLLTNTPLISDEEFLREGRFVQIKASRIPLTSWVFQHKVYIQMEAHTLSRQAFRFWKAIRDQKIDVNNLFQPISGRIPTAFTQTMGTPDPVEGIFYASSTQSKSIYILREHVPGPFVIPGTPPWNDTCLTLFPGGTTTKPTFWSD